MALKAQYEKYLLNAGADALSETASLHYVTTLTSIHTSAAIARHNAAQGRVLNKKQEKVLAYTEGQSSLSLEIDTTLEFISSGGAYLPGLDDNFVADRVVNFPMVHIVQFDPLGKIQQIRLYWDQGSLLKQVDVIGARAKNWPIRDGKDQTRLVVTSASTQESDSRPSTATSSTSGASKPRSQSNNVTRDPHASLALFAPREEDGDLEQRKYAAPKGSAKPPPRPYGDLFVGDDPDAENRTRSRSPKKGTGVIAPKSQSAKPQPRDYHDLFVGEDSPKARKAENHQTANRESILSPHIAPKIGSGKNYKPSRLFEAEEEGGPATPKSPEKGNYMKPHPKKYHHFEFGDGDDAPAPDANRPKTKHSSQWDFEDFVTPAKAPPTRKGDQNKRHFGWEDDETVTDSPTKHQAAPKPRPDAASNFEFQDDGTPRAERRPGTALGGTNARSSKLYQQSIIDSDDQNASAHDEQKPLSSITNVKDRRKDFDAHFDYADESPTQESETKRSIPVGRSKANQMDTHWQLTDESPPKSDKGNAKLLAGNRNKENLGAGGIKTGGDGMGGRAGSDRSWLTNKENVGSAGIKTGGNGMGGRAGSQRGWAIGDDSE